MTTAPLADQPQCNLRPWIVSPWWDLSYVVLTPVLIVPVVLILLRHWLTPEQVSLAVISFASLGHHLPGFMRAYGDQELFWRFPWRFILAPLVVFAIAICFTPPASLAERLSIPWTHLHGLELVLLIWGTWHGLMQTYGFMRIYDIKRGVNDRWSTRLDHWLCVVLFAAGVVFSDARVFAIADAVWQSGLPLPGPVGLERLRISVAVAGLAVTAIYVANLIRQTRAGISISWIKLLLVGTTGWFYWYTGRLSVNLVIGIAMFEIFHAIQYYAIVWIYNRRLHQRTGERFGFLGFLFRDRWTMLGLYLAAVGAYGSIRYFSMEGNAYIFSGNADDAYQWLLALFVTSAFMHFYFDGFIWKVSERKTQENLTDAPLETSSATIVVTSLTHAAKWAMLLSIVAYLLWSEHQRLTADTTYDNHRLAALAALTPNLPECQSMLCQEALARGDAATAIAFGEKAIQLRDNSHTAHADLGLAYLKASRLINAKNQFDRAISLAPHDWAHRCDLATVLVRLGDPEGAEQQLKHAIRLAPDRPEPLEQLADVYVSSNRMSDAEQLYRELANRFPTSLTGELGKIMLLNRDGKHHEAVELASFLAAGNGHDWRVLLALGSSLNAAGEADQALVPLQQAILLRPNSAEVFYQVGLAQFQLGLHAPALASLAKAIKLDTGHFGAHLQLANTYYVLGEVDGALAAFQKALDLKPGDATASANYGGLLAQLGMPEEAKKVYLAGLAANQQSGQLHYNLGVLLWQRGEKAEARELFNKAETLGIRISSEIKAALKE